MRIISRLDVKNGQLVKTINLEGLRPLGPASAFAHRYYLEGIDELFVTDPVASLYVRGPSFEILDELSKNIFIPITIGGGIRDVSDARRLLEHGADRVAINSAALSTPSIITTLAEAIGSQSVVVSIQARQVNNQWFCFTNCGRDNSLRLLGDWIDEAESRGAGEIILTSVQNEGTKRGVDTQLLHLALERATIPVTYSGGVGRLDHLGDLASCSSLSGICIAGAFHYELVTVSSVREKLAAIGFDMRVP